MHRFQFWPQNSLQMANTIKNWIRLNLRESEKNYHQWFDMFSNKNGCVHIKKSSKRWLNFSRNLRFDRRNPKIFDVTCSVILGTVYAGEGAQSAPSGWDKVNWSAKTCNCLLCLPCQPTSLHLAIGLFVSSVLQPIN